MDTDDLARARSWRPHLSSALIARVVLGLAGLLVFGLGWFIYAGGAQRVVVAAIRRAGGKVFYDWEVARIPRPDGDELVLNPGGRPPWNPALVALFGPDCFGDVVVVELRRNDDQYLRERLERQRDEESEDAVTRQKDADAALAGVARLPRLKRLAIAFTPVTDAGLGQLRALGGLEELSLGHLDVTTATGFQDIARLTQLRVLELEALPLTDAELALLEPLTALRSLELEQVKLTDAGMAHLDGLVHLRKLNLDSVAVTSAGLEHLRGMTGLTTLKLRNTGVQDLSALRRLAGLRALYIMRNPIDDNGLAPIAALAALEELDLSHTAVTDAALEHLQNLPRLSRLDLKKTHLTAEAVAAFRAARPEVRVEY